MIQLWNNHLNPTFISDKKNENRKSRKALLQFKHFLLFLSLLVWFRRFLTYHCLAKRFNPAAKQKDNIFSCRTAGGEHTGRLTRCFFLLLCRSTKQHINQTVVPGGQKEPHTGNAHVGGRNRKKKKKKASFSL